MKLSFVRTIVKSNECLARNDQSVSQTFVTQGTKWNAVKQNTQYKEHPTGNAEQILNKRSRSRTQTHARTHEGPRIRACRAVFSLFTEQSTMIKYTKWQKHFLDFLSINKLITTAFYWVRCCSAVKNFFCVHFGIHGWTLCMHLRAQCNAMQSNPMVKEATRSSFFSAFIWMDSCPLLSQCIHRPYD